MKKYYIQLKKNQQQNIITLLQDKLKLNEEEGRKLCLQGSVWNQTEKIRIKDPGYIVTSQLIEVYVPQYPVYEYQLNPVDIIYEDPYFIIVYKHAFVNTGPTPLSDLDNILHGVQKYYNSLKMKYNASCINRLDNPTQGLMFFAKNKEIEKKLHALFRDKNIKKCYIAATPEIDLVKNEWLIQDSLEWKGKSKSAATYIRFIKKHHQLNYFLVYPLTGRTHQIRKHFKKYILPIQGDALYGKAKRDDKLYLACFYYKFKHPATGKVMEVKYLDDTYQCHDNH